MQPIVAELSLLVTAWGIAGWLWADTLRHILVW